MDKKIEIGDKVICINPTGEIEYGFVYEIKDIRINTCCGSITYDIGFTTNAILRCFMCGCDITFDRVRVFNSTRFIRKKGLLED